MWKFGLCGFIKGMPTLSYGQQDSVGAPSKSRHRPAARIRAGVSLFFPIKSDQVQETLLLVRGSWSSALHSLGQLNPMLQDL